jgi:branched-chain amino acid transport system substrate-binding protein
MKSFIKCGTGFAAAIATLVFIITPGVSRADTIKIGAILALTGNSAAQGQNIRDGLQLAIDEINKRGGLNSSRIDLIVEDSKGDPQVAVAGFNKIENSQRPLFYVSQLSPVGIALAPLAEEKRVVLAGLVTAAIDFTRGREWVFRYWPMGLVNALPLLRILQDLKVKKLGILYQNDEYGREQQQLMTREFTNSGGRVTSQMVEMTDKDYRPKIAKLNDREAIFVSFTGAMLLGALQQLREANYRGAVMTMSSAAQPALFSLPELEGIYMDATIIHNPGYLFAKDAGNKFEARFKKAFDQWAASGYDFIKLVAGLLEERQASRQEVRDLLAGGFEYSGVFGQLRGRPGEHDISLPLYPVQVVNGKLKYR